jgi:Sigma-70, region 4
MRFAGSIDAAAGFLYFAACSADTVAVGSSFPSNDAGVIAGRSPAGDLLADVFRIAFEKRAKYQPVHEPALPWLLGIASRQVVVLAVHRGLSYEEIATASQIPVGTVRSHLNRARMSLRELFSASGNEQGARTNPRVLDGERWA